MNKPSLVIELLQLPSLLDINSIKYVNIKIAFYSLVKKLSN